MEESQPTKLKLDPAWYARRINVFVTQIICAAIISYLALKGEDTRLNETLVNGAYFLWGTVLVGYVFGVIVDEKFNSQRYKRDREDDDLPPRNFAG